MALSIRDPDNALIQHDAIIRSKTRVPAVADAVIERGRVVAGLAREAAGRRILRVVAPPGSGKTTAVVQFVASRPGPRAWLTLGEADGSPGRFVTYLAAAVAAIDPAAPGRVRDLLAHGVAPADCAALLVEDLPPDATVVIDDLHTVEDRPPVLAVLRALLDAVAPGALVVLVSRRMVHLDLSRSILTGLSGTVSAEELAFTTAEIGRLLQARGVDASPEEVAASSGGWAAGIVFDALRGARPGGPEPRPDDPFFGYLGAEVLASLPAALRRVVVRSSVLHTVDPRGLECLLGVPGDAPYRDILHHSLPATIEPEGLRYHPRFREYLLSLLREDPEEMRGLLARHARRLWADGHVEEAADHLIAAGETREAAGAVEAASASLLLRGDAVKVLSWCEALGEGLMARRPTLRGCQLTAMLAGRREEMPALVARLRESGEYDRLVAGDPDAATTAVFGLHMLGDWGSLLGLLPPDEASPGVRAMRYVLQVGSGEDPPRPWDGREVDELTPNVGLFQCGLYFQGRLDEVEHMAGLATGSDRVAVANTELYRIASLRQRGRLGDARAALQAVRPYLHISGFSDFWRHMESELLFAEGEREAALRMVREARELARRYGHRPADRVIFAATEGEMLVRMGRLQEGMGVLRDARAFGEEHGLRCFREWADVWLAVGMLRRGDPPDEALALLGRAVAGMERAERRLQLPVAYVALAEARWRAGDEAGHDAAADAARRAAEAMGSLGPLVAALDEWPDVLARRIDAGGQASAAWRDLARPHGSAEAPSSAEAARIVVGTLGRARLLIDGREQEVSPPRALDVAAAVARAGARGIPRAALAERLAGHSADAGNYVRQVVHRLRRLAPEGVALESVDGRLRWSPPGAVVTEDQVLRALVARARREMGEERSRTLGRALELAARGPLVAAAEGAGLDDLRDELHRLVAEARRDRALLLLRAGRAAEALAAARAAVAEEPYREDGWRLLMRATAAADGPSAAVPVFSDCADALAEIGLEPSRATRDLLARLRDEGGRPITAPG